MKYLQKYFRRLASLRLDQWVRILFWLALAIMLLPLWLNTYFVTGDGPCHLYNAKVLLDYTQPELRAFYDQYYYLNTHTNPNWLGHLVLAALLAVLPAFLAEKIFLTAYVIGYAFGVRWLVRSIKPDNAFLIFLGIPFAYAFPLQMGFFNYSLGILFFLVCMAAFVTYKPQFTWRRVIVFMALNTVLYFSHPVGWIFLVFGIGCLMLFYHWEYWRAKRTQRISTGFWMLHLKVVIALSPGVFMLFDFLSRRGADPSPNPYRFRTLFYDLVELRGLITMSYMEVVWALWISILFGALIAFGLWTKLRVRKIVWTDAFFLLFVCSVVIYFFQPGGMSGAGIMKERLSFLPFIMCLPWLASITYHNWIKWVVAMAAFALGTLLIAARLPIHKRASQAAEEIVSVSDSIQDKSTVLPLNFWHSGKTPTGTNISSRIWLFMHASDYIGTGKTLVMYGNYEAHTGNFPLRWHDNTNPFEHLCEASGGLEFQPPCADLQRFRTQTGKDVDYVILTFFDPNDVSHPHTQRLRTELEASYSEVFASKNRRAILYRRKGLQSIASPDS
jgi:hypothetical protein